jgi:hypothetical protein
MDPEKQISEVPCINTFSRSVCQESGFFKISNKCLHSNTLKYLCPAVSFATRISIYELCYALDVPNENYSHLARNICKSHFGIQLIKVQVFQGIKRLLRSFNIFNRPSVIIDDSTKQVGYEDRATMNENHEILKNRDYTLIIDKSGSMAITDEDEEKIKKEQLMKTRWELMKESTIALASKCEKLDPDGITVYTFSTNFKRYSDVTARKVVQIFEDDEPFGNTNLAGVLKAALDDYFQRKSSGQVKLNGETILVVTDGEADDPLAVIKTIVEATQKMDRDEELAISFIQIGTDKSATEYLMYLDDNLQKDKEAKFDIVDTITFEEIAEKGLSLMDVLLRAITD